MKRFETVRLRNGTGWIVPRRELVTEVPDVAEFRVAARPADDAVAFYVAIADDRRIAIVHGVESRALVERGADLASHLGAAGYPTTVCIAREAAGAALLYCFGSADDSVEYAACGTWALKALGGWDESELMVMHVTHVAEIERGAMTACDSAWVTVRGTLGAAWAVDVWRQRVGGWSTLQEEALACGESSMVVLAGVDWMGAYNDAYGQYEGDLLLARVHGRIEAAAMKAEASFIPVGGDKLAVVLRDSSTANAFEFAEALRREIEALNVHFEHPEVRTHGRVTLSLGVAVADPAHLRGRLEIAVQDAKRAGRNRVARAR